MSLINSFGQIRLSGQLVTTSGGRMQVGGANTLMVSDSGNFVGSNVLASTGQQAWTAADSNGRNLSGNMAATGAALAATAGATYSTIANLGATGQALYSAVVGLSGQFNTNQQNFNTLIPTGSGSLTVYFSPAFSVSPASVEATMMIFSANGFGYGIWTSQITAGSYVAQFSDVVLETGNYVHTIAHV